MHYGACLNVAEFNQDQTNSKELNKHILKVTISVSYFYLLHKVIQNHLVFQTLQVIRLTGLIHPHNHLLGSVHHLPNKTDFWDNHLLGSVHHLVYKTDWESTKDKINDRNACRLPQSL